jgi:hypothetical protein
MVPAVAVFAGHTTAVWHRQTVLVLMPIRCSLCSAEASYGHIFGIGSA